MKQAILITAYKNFAHLLQLVDFFDLDFNIYIHIDKKSNLPAIFDLELKRRKNVKLVTSKYLVNWGGVNHLKAILLLCKEALKCKDNSYFHLISGHDFPLKTNNEIKEFFEKHKGDEYIDVFEVPKKGWADNGGLDRLDYYNFYDLLDSKNLVQNGYIRRLVRLQKYLGFKRGISRKFPKLYGGSTWWSLSRECIQYILSYSDKNKFILRRFRYTLCSEEFFFQTIIMASPFATRVRNCNLRHIDWIVRNGNNPAVLDSSDFDLLKRSPAFFARKFDYPQSANLLQDLKTLLKNSNKS